MNHTTGKIGSTFPCRVGMKHGSTKGTSTSSRTWSGYQKLFFQFYQVHLDRMIRKNELLWGDSCKPRYHWNEVKEEWEKFLDPNMTGYDLTDPDTLVPPAPRTVIREPAKHFSFSTILILIELYQEESERKFCHYVTYAHQSLSSLWNRENR